MYHLETIICLLVDSYTVILSPHHTYDVRWRFSYILVAPIVLVVHLGAANSLITQQKALQLVDRTHRPQDTTIANSVCRITHRETM
jgi:hypothetical protein